MIVIRHVTAGTAKLQVAVKLVGQRVAKKANARRAETSQEDLVQRNAKSMTRKRTAPDRTNRSDPRKKIRK